MTEIDALMAGFAGGCLASIFLIGNYYYYLRAKTVQYIISKNDIQNHLDMRNAVLNIKEMQEQIRELYEELGEIDVIIKKLSKNP